MVNLATFEEFLVSGVTEISLVGVAVSLILAAALAYILSRIYVKYGTTLSSRKKFSNNFVLLATTTTLIITIVKSSLALSLGLVGALSIVRFRAAIKEPEELSFLFLCIAIGLGFGAGQIMVTIVAFFIISFLIVLRYGQHTKQEREDLHIVVSGKDVALKDVVAVIKRNSKAVNLRRFEENQDKSFEASFFIEVQSFQQLEKIRSEIKSLSKNISILYLDKAEV